MREFRVAEGTMIDSELGYIVVKNISSGLAYCKEYNFIDSDDDNEPIIENRILTKYDIEKILHNVKGLNYNVVFCK